MEAPKTNVTETLNIDYHVKILLLKALNSSNTQVEAAEKLKVAIRTVYRYIDQYSIVRQDGVWKINEA